MRYYLLCKHISNIFIFKYNILSNFISSTLCFIFHAFHPYMSYYRIRTGIIFNDLNSPDTHIVVLIAFNLILYEVLTQNKIIENKLVGKII